MRKPKRATQEEWAVHRTKQHLPIDAAVHCPGNNPSMFYDASWRGPRGKLTCRRTPKWYRQNHSGEPNVSLELRVEGGEKQVVWIALRSIKEGEELCYTYARTDWGAL